MHAHTYVRKDSTISQHVCTHLFSSSTSNDVSPPDPGTACDATGSEGGSDNRHTHTVTYVHTLPMYVCTKCTGVHSAVKDSAMILTATLLEIKAKDFTYTRSRCRNG